MSTPMDDPLRTLRDIRRRDPRFALESYPFIFQALEFTVKRVGKHRHVTGAELLEGIRDFAFDQFGPLAEMVFRTWGVKKSADFGEIVFNLVESGLLGKTTTDSREDFQGGFDIDLAFEEMFRKARCPKIEPN